MLLHLKSIKYRKSHTVLITSVKFLNVRKRMYSNDLCCPQTPAGPALWEQLLLNAPPSLGLRGHRARDVPCSRQVTRPLGDITQVLSQLKGRLAKNI